MLEVHLGQYQKLVEGEKFSHVGVVPVCLLMGGDLSTSFPLVNQDFPLQNHSLCTQNCCTFKLTTS